MVSIAVLAEVIFFSRIILRELSSFTKMANSPKTFDITIIPEKLNSAPSPIYHIPRGIKSFPIRKRHEV